MLLCQGLAHLHGLAIVHGDIKPDNVLLDDDGHPKISDWGLSRVSHGLTSVHDAASKVGYTPGYAAPEVEEGKKTTFASDMYVWLGWLHHDCHSLLSVVTTLNTPSHC